MIPKFQVGGKMAFALFLILISDSLNLKPDEIYMQKAGYSARNEDRLLISWSKGMEQQLGLFSFREGHFKILEDSRIRVISPYIVPSEKGFLLVEKLGHGSIIQIDWDGKYVKSSRLNSLKGWDPNLQMTFLAPVKRDQALVTLKHREQKLLLLGRLNFKEESLELVHQTKIEDQFTRYWVPLGKDFILANRETGQIDLHDSKGFAKIRRLREGDPLQEKNSRKFKHLSRRSKYWAILSRPVPLNGKVYFFWNKVFDDYGEPYKSPVIKTLILDETGKLSESDVVPLGIFEGKKLVYHWMDMEVFLE